MSDLKACPFCGFVAVWCDHEGDHQCHYIECRGCKVSVNFAESAPEDCEDIPALKEHCATLWNRRATVQPEVKP